jgi:hypothetical protein
MHAAWGRFYPAPIADYPAQSQAGAQAGSCLQEQDSPQAQLGPQLQAWDWPAQLQDSPQVQGLQSH